MQTCIWPSGFHCHSLSLASVKSKLVLPFWYWLTRVVPDKGPLNGCVCVCVYSTVLSYCIWRHCIFFKLHGLAGICRGWSNDWSHACQHCELTLGQVNMQGITYRHYRVSCTQAGCRWLWWLAKYGPILVATGHITATPLQIRLRISTVGKSGHTCVLPQSATSCFGRSGCLPNSWPSWPTDTHSQTDHATRVTVDHILYMHCSAA